MVEHESSKPDEQVASDDDTFDSSPVDNGAAETSALETSALESAVDEAMVEELAAGQSEVEDRVLRAQAELENFRKRSRRELDEQRKYAAVPLIRDLLVVLDNLDLAVGAGDNENATGLLEGVKMVAVQFKNVLQQYSCQAIPAVGADFDPNLHEAVGQEPSEQFAAGVVSRELRVGYQLHDRVVRPSQVFVSSGEAQQNTSSQE